MKNVLISAYACEPGMGSEPGVGWNWSVEIAKLGYVTHVVTRRNNRQRIEAELSRNADVCERIRFYYVDLPGALLRFKKGKAGLYLYYFIWQVLARRVIRNIALETKIDCIHYVTLGSIRLPILVPRVGGKLIVGPLGGGETTPPALRRSFPFRGRVVELIRDLSNTLSKYNPLVSRCLRRADRILLRTKDNIRFMPSGVAARLEICGDVAAPSEVRQSQRLGHAGPLKLLYAGRLIYWKGMHLGLKAFAQHLTRYPASTLTIVGDGPEAERLQTLAKDIGVDHAIFWKGWIPHESLSNVMVDHDIFLFPSLHDSGGSVVLEAASSGLPVIALDTGGPGQMVDQSWGEKVSIKGTEADVVSGLSAAILTLDRDRSALDEKRVSAVEHAKSRGWSSIVGHVFQPAEDSEPGDN